MKTKEQLAKDHVEGKWKNSELSDLGDLLDAPKNDEIMAFIAGHEAAEPKWISVDDALPELLEPVYIFLDTGNQFKGIKYANGWTAFYADGEKSVSPDIVTHWQPLLPPPKNNTQ